MQLNKINENLQVSGEVYSNSKRWGHEVKAFYCGREVMKHRVTYYNRTWERYTFETAFKCLLDKMDEDNTIPLADRVAFSYWIKNK